MSLHAILRSSPIITQPRTLTQHCASPQPLICYHWFFPRLVHRNILSLLQQLSPLYSQPCMHQPHLANSRPISPHIVLQHSTHPLSTAPALYSTALSLIHHHISPFDTQQLL